MNAKTPTLHTVTYEIDFSQTDQGGRLFYSRVFELAHRCLESFASAQNIYKKWFQKLDWMSPIVSTKADYKAPIRLGDCIEIELFCSAQSEHSITWNFDFHRVDEEKTLCQLELTQVFLNSSGQKTKAPEELSRLLKS